MNRHHIGRFVGVRIGLVIGGLILAAGLAFLFGLVVMWLWNWIMPVVFSLPKISYLHAWGLVLLAHILFKSPGIGRSARGSREKWGKRASRNRWGGKREPDESGEAVKPGEEPGKGSEKGGDPEDAPYSGT